MAAPTITAREESAGLRQLAGFSTKITFTIDPNVSFWEKDVQPPGYDGGDKIDTTTMFNTLYRTAAARTLIEITDGAATVAYDPLVFTEIVSLINVNGSVNVEFPDGSTLSFFGYLKSFEPQPLADGEQPEANVVFVVTNYDPDNNVEQGPVETDVAGTP